MASIDRFTSRTQAQLACGLLTAHGIEAYVSSDDAGGAYPQLPYGHGGTVVVVPDELLADALALLDHAETGRTDDGVSDREGAERFEPHDVAMPSDRVPSGAEPSGLLVDGTVAGEASVPGGTTAGSVRPRRRLLIAALAAAVTIVAVAMVIAELLS